MSPDLRDEERFLRNKYFYWYEWLMQQARGWIIPIGEYTESHHIIPAALPGGPESEQVRLTYREHFLAHWLLPHFTRFEDRQICLGLMPIMLRDNWGYREPKLWQRVTAARMKSMARRSRESIEKQILTRKINSGKATDFERWLWQVEKDHDDAQKPKGRRRQLVLSNKQRPYFEEY